MKTKTNKNSKATKTQTAPKQTELLTSEAETVLKCIVKNPELGASEIKKKLKWGYVPSRALGQLKDNGFATMDDDKGYHVTAAGRKALEK